MEKDLVDYEYLSDNLRYADLFNGVLFGGKEVIAARELSERDSKVISGKRRKLRSRDLVRKYGMNMNLAVLGVENQEEVNYCMPFRMQEYETAEYGKQVAEIKRRNRTEKDLTPGEFLEHYQKMDKIQPCISLVLFWGAEWDGPMKLTDMMNLENLPEGMRKYVNDYPIHLVNVRKIEDTSVFKTDLKLVFDFLKCSESKEKMKELLVDNPAYQTLDMDAYDVMMVHSHSKELEELRHFAEGNDGDMCKALQDWAAEEREIGMEQGISKGIEQGIERGMQLLLYKMISHGKLSIKDAINELGGEQSEEEFIAKMYEAGYQLP